MTPSAAHNAKLLAEFMAKSNVFSRYPKVCDQAECLLLGTESLPKFAYNPSILRVKDKFWMTYRYHFAGDYRTRLGIAVIADGGRIEKTADLPLEGIAQEDARLFSLHADPWVSWVESNITGPRRTDPKCVVRYGRLTDDWKIERIYQPAGGGNDMTSMQKNWCFFESDENLFIVFESWPEQIVFQVMGEKVVNEYRTKPVRWPYGPIRGGSIVPHEGKLLRFFHSSVTQSIGRVEHRYFIGAALMNPRPPFETLAVSQKPILYGSEIDGMKSAERKACFHWKPNVCFPCGAIPFGKDFLLACGINDAACSLVKIKKEDLRL